MEFLLSCLRLIGICNECKFSLPVAISIDITIINILTIIGNMSKANASVFLGLHIKENNERIKRKYPKNVIIFNTSCDKLHP